MPKVYLSDMDRAAAKAERGDDALRMLVATRIMRSGWTQKAIAERLNVAPVTLARWLKKPDKMPIGMLRRLGKVLDFTDAETAKCV